jgi:hypothetical protein
MVTDAARYRALDRGLRRLHQSPFRIRIAGAEALELTSEHVTAEGANTSFQMHLRVAPEYFTRVYNAAQLATAPVLAAAGNSPVFLGRRLWEETRIALFKQSVEDRRRSPRRGPARAGFGTGWLRGGALEQFTESVRRHEPLLPFVSDARPEQGVPPLDELRLHQGTVWRWNRAIYDPSAGGHLRIEMRALPAGPTLTDMLANAAFLIGLTLWLASWDERWTYAVPFERADTASTARPSTARRRAELAGRRRRVGRFRRRTGARTAARGPAGAAGRGRGRGGGRPPARRDRRTCGERADRGRLAARRPGVRRARPGPGRGPRRDARPVPIVRGHRPARPYLARLTGDAPLQPGAGRRRVRVGGLEPQLAAELLGPGGQVAQPAAAAPLRDAGPVVGHLHGQHPSEPVSTVTSTWLAFACLAALDSASRSAASTWSATC